MRIAIAVLILFLFSHQAFAYRLCQGIGDAKECVHCFDKNDTACKGLSHRLDKTLCKKPRAKEKYGVQCK